MEITENLGITLFDRFMSQPWAAAKIYAGSKPKGATVKKPNSPPPPLHKKD